MAGARLREAEFGGVEEIAGQRGKREFADAELRGGAVERVADDGMMQRGEVHADLVGAAGVQLDFEERGRIDAGEGAPVRAGFAGFAEDEAAAGGHAGAPVGVASDGEVDGAVVLFQEAFHQGEVDFFDLALAEGFAEFGVRGVIFGD